MRTRILPAEEWAKLHVTELPELLHYINPANADVVVVEDEDGKLVGSLAVLRVTHFEGVWVAPEYRGRYVLANLLNKAEAIAEDRGETWVLGAAKDDDKLMDDLIRRRGGVPLPLRVYTMPVGVS